MYAYCVGHLLPVWGGLPGFHSVYVPFSVCFSSSSFLKVKHTDLHSQLPGVQYYQVPMKHVVYIVSGIIIANKDKYIAVAIT